MIENTEPVVDEVPVQDEPIDKSLQLARELAGWSRAEVAVRLNLGEKYIEYMETQAFDKLPAPTFARGYIKSYARLLSVDATPLLARYADYCAQQIVPEKPVVRIKQQIKPSDPLVRWSTYAILVAVLALSMLWWSNQHESRTPVVAATAPPESDTQAEAASAAQHASSLALAGQSRAMELTESQGELEQQAIPVEEPITEEIKPEEEVAAAEPTAPGMTEPMARTASQMLQVRFAEACWLEVRDAQGETIFTGTKRAGEELNLATPGLFDLVVGNPAAVSIKHNGAAVDLSEWIANGRIARFTLGAS